MGESMATIATKTGTTCARLGPGGARPGPALCPAPAPARAAAAGACHGTAPAMLRVRGLLSTGMALHRILLTGTCIRNEKEFFLFISSKGCCVQPPFVPSCILCPAGCVPCLDC